LSLIAAPLFALAAAAGGDWTVDAPLALHARSPSSNVDTIVEPWGGVRVGRRLDGPFAVDAGLYLGGASEQGTGEVYARRAFGALELRGLAGMELLASTYSALSSYAFLGAGGGAGAATVTTFETQRTNPLLTWHARGGGGLEMRIRAIVTRVELGLGIRDARLEISSALAIGLRF
jgi:hypothetical protein